MQSPKQSFAHLSLVALISLGSSQMASAASYSFTILENLGTGSEALDINNAGVIVGGITSAQFDSTIPVSWHNGLLTQLPTNGKGGYVTGVNNHGMMVGNVVTPDGKFRQAASWNNGVLNSFGNSITDDYSMASSINDAGQIAGFYYDDKISNSFKIENGIDQALPSLFGRGSLSFAYAINSSGTVVGASYDAQSNTHATVWQNGVPTELASQGTNSNASGINDAGEVVGRIDSSAVIWRDGIPTEIYSGYAFDINNKGQIVGGSVTGENGGASLWENGNLITLATLIDPAILGNWFLRYAYAINDNGDIVGQAHDKGDARISYAFLLKLNTENPPPADMSTVPLPASLPLMLSGLGLLGGILKRKSKA